MSNDPIPEAAMVRSTPKWVGVMIAVVLVGSMAGGAGLWAWSYYSRPDQKTLTEVSGSSASRTIIRSSPVTVTQYPKAFATNVRQQAANTYEVAAGDFYLIASRTTAAAGADWRVQLGYRKSDLLTEDQKAARMAQSRFTMDTAYAEAMKVTEEQMTKLKALPTILLTSPTFVANAADLAKLKDLWVPFFAAPKDSTALVKAVEEAGRKNLASSRTALEESVKKIQAILTPEQIAAFKTQQ
jgi:hypothetical protein